MFKALVVGKSTVAKSSLINAFWGKDSCAVGNGRESFTSQPECTRGTFPPPPMGDSNLDVDIELWDMPGFPGDTALPSDPGTPWASRDAEFSHILKSKIAEVKPQLIILVVRVGLSAGECPGCTRCRALSCVVHLG